jgi:lipopolysaccharide transport system ATP-binding protein
MSSDTYHAELIVQVKGLGKKFVIGRSRTPSTLREALAKLVRRRPLREAATTDFWALRDVSFGIRRGEILGIIGRNGAGKSTLLKILSRIIEPDEGSASIYGRVGSLLEVGTGFHGELTGRENVFLSGAILGMRRKEITKRFDEIVEYADIGRFLDTPVKHYSSGMYMRLAFSVAAHLEPEILVIDEVLAVGDAEFQRKCLGKMASVAESGRTVLFVSHNMSAVRSLCARAIVLEAGKIVHDGSVESAISAYQGDEATRPHLVWESGQPKSPLWLERIECELRGTQPSHTLELVITTRHQREHLPAFIAVDIADVLGTPLMQAVPVLEPFIRPDRPGHSFRVHIGLPPLIPGTYRASVWIGPHFAETFDWVPHAVAFDILDSPSSGRSFPHSSDHGYIVAHAKLEMVT